MVLVSPRQKDGSTIHMRKDAHSDLHLEDRCPSNFQTATLCFVLLLEKFKIAHRNNNRAR